MVRFTRRPLRTVVSLGVCALLTCTLPFGALAAQNNLIQADLTGDLSSSTLGTGGSFFIYAYSIQNQVVGPPLIPAVGPNAVITATAVSGGAAPSSLPYSTQGGSISVPTGKVGLPPPIFDGQKMFQGAPRMSYTPYGPAIRVGGLGKNTLSRSNDYASVLSTSGIYNGMGQAFVSSKGVRGIFATAYINGTPPPGGAAAGQAADPFQIPSGTAYPYTPTVTASAEIDSPNVSGGFQAYAVDSSVFTSDSVDNFIADGAPLGSTLWEVTVGRDMPTSSGITVDFELNPQALNEIQFPSAFLQSLGTFPDAITEAFLIDQAIDQSLQSQLTQTGSEFDLTGATLFPAGTTFQAIAGGVEYADDVDAGIAASPEPASVVILLAGGFTVLARRRRSVYKAS